MEQGRSAPKARLAYIENTFPQPRRPETMRPARSKADGALRGWRAWQMELTVPYRIHDVPVDGGALRVGEWGPDDPAVPTVIAVHGITAIAPGLGRGSAGHAAGRSHRPGPAWRVAGGGQTGLDGSVWRGSGADSYGGAETGSTGARQHCLVPDSATRTAQRDPRPLQPERDRALESRAARHENPGGV